MTTRLRGIWGFPPTPFKGDTIDFEGLAECVDHQVRGKVDVLCACGAIAEVDSLTPEDWRRCAELVVAHAAGVPTVVTIPVQANAAVAAEQAADLGVDGMLVLPRSAAVGDIKELLASLAAAAPGVPLVLYHRSPLKLSVDDLKALCEVESLRGLKDGHRDVRLYRRLHESVRDRLLWLSSWEDVALAFWAVGCDAFAPASAAYAPAYSRAWLGHLEAGNIAEARRLLAAHAYAMVDLRLSRPGIDITAVKTAMAEMGLPSGEARSPALPLTNMEHQLVSSLVQALAGLLESSALAASGSGGSSSGAAMSGEGTELRSDRWYGPDTLKTFGHRSRTKQLGFSTGEFVGRPVIGILNTWSEITPCHQHFRQRAEDVKRGVWSSGGFPLELPALSLSEPFQKPTTMMYRNLLALEAEELIRSYPLDGVVLMGGCDKTVPGLVMGALSATLPSIFLPAGPMLRGNWRGRPLGSGTDVWRHWADRRAGLLDEAAWTEIEDGIARSPGHCMTMGTASTMTAAVDALGLSLPGASSIVAVDARHARMAAQCGRRIVELVRDGNTPEDILTPASFENAVVAVLAIGGSTNAVIHLVAMAARAGFELTLDRFDELSRATPVIADISPTGRFLMEDFAYAGGLLALLTRVRDLLSLECLTVSGRTLGAEIAAAEVYNDEVIRPRDRPVAESGALVVLRGSLAPDGAVIKPHAGSPRLQRHEGPAMVFDSMAELSARIDDPSLEITEDSVLVLRNAGPVGAGMPEWGMLPIPRRLLEKGVRDMVRISDARMSGTSYGTCVLHVAPEAAVGGPLGLVRTGDPIRLDVETRRLDLLVDDGEVAARRAVWAAPPSAYSRGYGRLFVDHVAQANAGCDFDFLGAGEPTPEPEIY